MSQTRGRSCIDFDWRFFLGDAPGAEKTGFDDSGWRRLDLPHDFSIEANVSETCESGARGGFYPGGIGWYRKTFAVPADARDKAVSIEFDGVYRNSDVWINGRHLGRRPYGYIGFRYDLSPFLNYGGENVLAVRADNSQMPNSRWYSGSGIYRHVWMTVTDKVHVAHWGSYVTTPRVSEDSAVVLVRTTVENESGFDRNVALVTTICDATGETLAASSTPGAIAASGRFEFFQTLDLDGPSLWSPDNPYLYLVRSEICDRATGLDEYETPFGVRTFHFDANKGFSLNERRMKLLGVNLHHDGGCVGAAVPEGVWARRLRLLKEMGCNAIRTSHNPPAPEFLDLCDRVGFMVMDETFDEWAKPKVEHSYGHEFKEWGERDLRGHVRRDRNHPSVILWSIGNEIPEKGEIQGAATARRLVAICHEEDPTRPVTCGCNVIAAAHRSGFTDALDVVGYNGGGGSKFQYEGDHRAWPHRKTIGTEVPHSFATRGVYRTITHYRDEKKSDFKNMMRIEVPDLTDEEVFPEFPDYYYSSYDNALVRCGARDCWAMTKRFDYLCGEFRWTGIDYLGESHAWPAKSSNAGVIDLCGFPKDPYYFYQSQWTGNPMVHLLPHWTWPGKEGTVIPVWCYTNCESVELFLNGKSLGARKLGRRMNLSWDVPYRPGTLRAEGRRGAKAVCVVEVRTAGAPAAIVMTADRDSLVADGRDVVHLEVRIVDGQGLFVPNAGNLVTFLVEGEGRLLGVDNGDPACHLSFKGDRMNAFHGLCLAVARSSRQSGKIRVSAVSEGLKEAIVNIAVAQGGPSPQPNVEERINTKRVGVSNNGSKPRNGNPQR